MRPYLELGSSQKYEAKNVQRQDSPVLRMNLNLSDELIKERTQTHEVIIVKTVADMSAIATSQETQIHPKLEKRSCL